MSTGNQTDFSQHGTVDSQFTLAKSILLCAVITCHHIQWTGRIKRSNVLKVLQVVTGSQRDSWR